MKVSLLYLLLFLLSSNVYATKNNDELILEYLKSIDRKVSNYGERISAIESWIAVQDVSIQRFYDVTMKANIKKMEDIDMKTNQRIDKVEQVLHEVSRKVDTMGDSISQFDGMLMLLTVLAPFVMVILSFIGGVLVKLVINVFGRDKRKEEAKEI